LFVQDLRQCGTSIKNKLPAHRHMKKRKDLEKKAKLRLLHRLLISYNDFHQASQIASYILRHRLQEKVDRLRGPRRYQIKLLWQALNCAMVVSYCRPFSGNDRRLANPIPDLPKRFLKRLTPEEKELHRVAMQDRNTLLAHSDSQAWNLRPFFLETGPGHRMLVPLHSDVRAPLVHAAVEQLQKMCTKLMDFLFEERMQLEKELTDLFPVTSAEEQRVQSSGEVVGG